MTLKPEDNHAAFMGVITAGATHELNNVLAIIQETAGLMKDLCALEADAPFPRRDTITRSLDTIENQIRRGVRLLAALNQFAHSADQETATLDLWATVDRMIVLCRRFASMKKVTLSLQGPNPAFFPVTRPLMLELVLFSALHVCLGLFKTSGDIGFRLTPENDGFAVDMRFTANDPDQRLSAENLISLAAWQALQTLMPNLAGELRLLTEQPGLRLILPADLDSLSDRQSASEHPR